MEFKKIELSNFEKNILNVLEKKSRPVDIVKIVRLAECKSLKKIKLKDIIICGAYILTILEYPDPIYIGSSNDFSKRCNDHINNKIKGFTPKSAYIFETKDIIDAKKLENWLIYELSPQLNDVGEKKGLDEYEIKRFKTRSKNKIRRKGLYDLLVEQNKLLNKDSSI